MLTTHAQYSMAFSSTSSSGTCASLCSVIPGSSSSLASTTEIVESDSIEQDVVSGEATSTKVVDHSIVCILCDFFFFAE